ncbi:hypothetical protein [uncultured Methylibium sp.]|uniref:hypothetical protein n=1 Tax=uncultured Methylibium sp. TaxID=381093 RepID=UPI0025EEA7B7|nr:hypothetical protein [uncultured Methylibium sp.]
MSKPFQLTGLLLAACLAAPLAVQAKLPAPSPEAKAKADEARAKTAHGDKVAGYKLCLSMDKTAAHYFKSSGKDAKSATATPPCADPGAFVPVAAAPTPPLEAAGAHSPPKTAAAPPSGKATAAEQQGAAKK